MCLNTDSILLQYALHQFQYFITTCREMLEIYEQTETWSPVKQSFPVY